MHLLLQHVFEDLNFPLSSLSSLLPRCGGSALPPLHPVPASGGAPGSERARPAHPPRGHDALRQTPHSPVHAEGHQPAGGRSALLQTRYRGRQHRGGAHGDVLREVGHDPESSRAEVDPADPGLMIKMLRALTGFRR